MHLLISLYEISAALGVLGVISGRDELLSIGVKPEKVKVIPFPVYPVFVKRSDEIPDLNHGLSFGRITPKKGIEVLFEALKLVPDEIRVSIAGSPAVGCESYADSLKERAALQGLEKRVSFLGFIEDDALSKLMYTIGFTILPYMYVTHSAVLMTALGHGVPYIASDLPAFREIYQHYKGGLLFEAGNSRSLADGIRQLADPALRSRFANEARAARERNNWKTYTDIMEKYYGS